MKLLFAVVVVAFMAIISVSAEETYTTKFDNIDVDGILRSDRLFNNYYKCLIDEAKCTPDGRELKKTLPDALQTCCSKCTKKQKDISDKLLRFVIDNKKDEWDVLKKKYDPEGIYVNKYKQKAEAHGVKI